MSLLRSRYLQFAAIFVATTSAAAASNTTPANVNVLNLLSPFLGLNSTTIGQTTLADNLAQAVAVNTSASLSLQELAYSDKNLLGAAVNSVTGVAGAFGVAANLAGGLPDQPAPTQGGVTGVPGVQPVGGLGATLGGAFTTGVNAYAAGTSTALTNTVTLLTKAYSFTSSDLGVSKNYFANGTINGTAAAVAPAGYALPTFNGLPNTTNSVYDAAYGVANTDPGQNIYGNSRPAQVSNQIKVFDPTALNGIATNPAFPSGHTNYAYTDSVLIGMLAPQSYQSMLVRASEYANSRIVLGVHYPLDIIASRSFAAYDLAQAFTNPAYVNSATTTAAPINLPQLYNSANAELSPYLCGSANCAADKSNPYAPSASNAQVYADRLTYGLPTDSYAQAPREQAPAGGPDASILLAPIFGGGAPAAVAIAPAGGIYGKLATSTINQIIVNTEGQALQTFYGTDLSYWSRVNLYAAIGYFDGVTGTLKTADGDHLTIDVKVASGGVIDVTGLFTVDGTLIVDAGGALDFTIDGLVPQTGFSQIVVGKTADVEGELDITLDKAFGLKVGDRFKLIDTAQGFKDGVSALRLDGAACSALGGGVYDCLLGGQEERFWLGVDDGDLTFAVVPEASTWALVMAGFAGVACLRARRRPARALA